jgi:amino acid permease
MMDDLKEERNVDKHGDVQVAPFQSDVETGSMEASGRGIKPRLDERHIQMIAIAGVIVRTLFDTLLYTHGHKS